MGKKIINKISFATFVNENETGNDFNSYHINMISEDIYPQNENFKLERFFSEDKPPIQQIDNNNFNIETSQKVLPRAHR